MWRRRGAKARRPMSSIILYVLLRGPSVECVSNCRIFRDHEIKDTILEDARDFLRSSSWYADRGIPFRRGKLRTLRMYTGSNSIKSFQDIYCTGLPDPEKHPSSMLLPALSISTSMSFHSRSRASTTPPSTLFYATFHLDRLL